MTKLSTVPYAYEPGLIARLLGVALEAAHAYLVRCKAIVYMKNRVSFPLINSLCLVHVHVERIVEARSSLFTASVVWVLHVGRSGEIILYAYPGPI